MSRMRITDNGGEESPWPDLDMVQFRRDKAKENEYNYYTAIAQPVASEPGLRPPIIPVARVHAPVVDTAPIAPVAPALPTPVAPAPVVVAPVPVPVVPTAAELEEAEMMRSAFSFIDE